MLYLLYVLIGLLIIILTDLLVTACMTLNDIYRYRHEDRLEFITAFKKYFSKNNNLPLKASDWKLKRE
ncbi:MULTISPECIES: hypothetical protein [Lactobacillus]|uniref:Uncharacterized protein n=1 Tax=Lactobacillus panisapium TaxID=2012495 RepID=A0ABX8W3Q7_9LACO|nr:MULTISPECIES: hypothetical protein [Lactobacillus]MCO6532175.1 hypothetical protein [Lactobacillus sp.]MCX8720720.1 hypothetical protein [Lactobacillus sp. B4010]MCX8724029.1 hypothetical protein [Lactobacillus sp. B4005]MCX8731824.1 hypothetical protein [Lactobacillus sp. B4015]MCX8733902.1 hypothetical protein [Lactobacillus sp. B4012]